MGMPLTITLYNEDNEPIQTYAALGVSWRLVKRACDLIQRMADGLLGDAERAVLRALLVETFDHQFALTELESGASLDEQAILLSQIAGKFPVDLGLPAEKIERMLVLKHGWTLRDIGETDVDTLSAYLRTMQQQITAAMQPSEMPQPTQSKPAQTYCDQVDWL
jgi:hypothetical protein